MPVQFIATDLAGGFPQQQGKLLYRERLSDMECLTQLVFCDFSTPNSDRFNVCDDIKSNLIAHGIPDSEIAYHDADTAAKKKELFAKARFGCCSAPLTACL
ncbi:MAG: hypothetical protein LBU32_20965 [Clostridiales bacterium]|jgi:hypothetical protein|nr:hypothetical protein [Clostridiales bacterium]